MKLYPRQVPDNTEKSLELHFYSYQMSSVLFGALCASALNYIVMLQLFIVQSYKKVIPIKRRQVSFKC